MVLSSKSNIFLYLLDHRIFMALIPCSAIISVFVTMVVCYYLLTSQSGVPSEMFDVFNNDISSYGIGFPQFYAFGTGFTVTALFATATMALRHAQLDLYNPGKMSNKILFFVGASHSVPLIIMGWTDGFFGQRVHFPAAVVGLGILALYCIGHAFYSVNIFSKGYRPEKGIKRYIAIVSTVLYFIFGFTSPICVTLWITQQESFYEWLGVGALIIYFLPITLEFITMESQPDITTIETLL
eukprot:TRINITY_DN5351_c0_g1_i1.p1 TRINITY_DN5351_c0_g1~~TRINITY_DN5351_c0_g1_i1.p1  ORF type:complete len:240 (-),score=13.86 TRINITY_DN5351_c0_g1_i1:359-1078(-)